MTGGVDLTGDIPEREWKRVLASLEKLQREIDHASGGRGGNQVRRILTDTGKTAARHLRSTTPVRTGGLKKAVKAGPIQTTRYGMRYHVGYKKDRVERFQQILAIEFGTRRMRARRLIEKTLAATVGNGARLAGKFATEMQRVIDDLAATHNSRSGRR